MKQLILMIWSIFFMLINLFCQEEKKYIDSRRNEVVLSHGNRSFVDNYISYKLGSPEPNGLNSNPQNAIGEPDYNGKVSHRQSYFSLGCGGEVVFEFNDNGLVNKSGPDLYIFEIGPAIEATDVFISEDNRTWTYVGVAFGGTAALDLDGKVNNETVYYFIKLIDLKQGCRGGYPGADIDAIAAIGSSTNEVKSQNEENRNSNIYDTVTISSQNVSVLIWDNEKEDGDIIEVILNGETIISRQSVLKKGKKIELRLNDGINIFEIKALNEGKLHPNTAAIQISDGKNVYEAILNSKIGKSKALKIVVE